MKRLDYEEPQLQSQAEVTELLRTGSVEVVSNLLIGFAFYEEAPRV